MCVVLVEDAGVQVRTSGSRLVAGEAEVPLAEVDSVVVVGGAGVTTPALCRLLDGGTRVVFVTTRGRYRGALLPATDAGVAARAKQHRMRPGSARALEIAREIVRSKIAHCRELCLRHRRNHPSDELDLSCEQLRSLGARATGADSTAELRGVEGAAAAAWYRALPSMLRGEFSFNGRSRRPPRDPVNAMLSFGYVLLTGEAVAALHAAGLDPYAGVYHAPGCRRPALGLDLVEEFRCLVDSMVLSLVNRREAREDMFQRTEGGGVHLNARGRAVFLREYQAAMGQRPGAPQSARRAVATQAHKLAGAITGGTAYRGFPWRP